MASSPSTSLVHPGDALGDALLVEVGEDDGDAEAPDEEEGELAGHQPGADDADLGDRAGQGLVRGAGGALGPLLDEVEGVEPGAQLVGHDEVAERLVLGGEGLVAGGGAGGPDELDGPQGAGRATGGLGEDDLAAGVARGVPRGLVAVDLGALDLHGAGEDASGPAQRVLEEVGRLEQHVGDAEADDLLAP